MTEERRRGAAGTAADAADPELRGRTYSIPFEGVWQTALQLAGTLSGWSITASNDQDGVIRCTTRSMRGSEHDVVIRICLDADAQTRVDVTAEARKPASDFGAAKRRIARFCSSLDGALEKIPRPNRIPSS